MLLQNYKVTIKNLLRSGMFWIMLVVTSFVSLNESFQYESKGYSRYIKWFSNCIGSLAGYTLPLFTILTVILILTRDYEDDFFEIEKSSNIKTSHYLLGRIFALFTVNFLVGFLLTFIAFYIPFLKNPLEFTGIIYFLLDSSERLMRQVLFVIVPQILFFYLLHIF